MAEAGARRSLATYQAKRDFERTPEPSGADAAATAEGGHFVVQRHRARRLHYDLRLELDGVLVSWAVPKGPTLDPAARHLAVHVEDHPLEYRDFEGVIPAGEYGGGDVIVWDEGTWRPPPGVDPHRALAEGNLHFDLFGHKLAGRFVLVRRGRDGRGGKQQWLLLHKRDADAVDGWDPEEHPHSVKSGRTNDEVAEAPEAMWDPDRPASEAEVPIGPATAGSGTAGLSTADLADLEALDEGGRWTIEGKALRLSQLDSVVIPARGGLTSTTKRDLVRYVVRAGPALLTYLREQPAELRRFASGRSATWQRTPPAQAPRWLVAERAGTRVLRLDSVAALAWAANRSAVELYTTTAQPDGRGPGWAWLDLEPGRDTPPAAMAELAHLCRAALDHLGLEGRVRTVGKFGLQLWVPADRRHGFDDTLAWAEALARTIAATSPELAVAGTRLRGGHELVRLHSDQNAEKARLLVPYSVQAVPGALVSVPLAWEELRGSQWHADRWTIGTVPARLDRQGDPLAALVGWRQPLPPLG